MCHVIALVNLNSQVGRACAETLAAVRLQDDSKDIVIRCCFSDHESRDVFFKSSTRMRQLYERDDKCLEFRFGIDPMEPYTLEDALFGCSTAVLEVPQFSAIVADPSRTSLIAIDAAMRMGTRRIIHVSSWAVRHPLEVPQFASNFAPSEEYLLNDVELSCRWTVLRMGFLLDSLPLFFGTAIRENNALGIPPVYCAPVDGRDVGEAVAHLCLLSDMDFDLEFHGAFLNCSGPEIIELPDDLDRTLKKPSKDVASDDQAVAPSCASISQIVPEIHAYMQREKEMAIPFDPIILKNLLGRNPTDMPTWAREHEDIFYKVGLEQEGYEYEALSPKSKFAAIRISEMSTPARLRRIITSIPGMVPDIPDFIKLPGGMMIPDMPEFLAEHFDDAVSFMACCARPPVC